MAIDEYGQIIRRTPAPKSDDANQDNHDNNSEKIARLRGANFLKEDVPEEKKSNNDTPIINKSILQKKLQDMKESNR